MSISFLNGAYRFPIYGQMRPAEIHERQGYGNYAVKVSSGLFGRLGKDISDISDVSDLFNPLLCAHAQSSEYESVDRAVAPVGAMMPNRGVYP